MQLPRQTLDKPIKFGKYKGLTPEQIIVDKNDLKYIEWVKKKGYIRSCKQLEEFIDNYKLENNIK